LGYRKQCEGDFIIIKRIEFRGRTHSFLSSQITDL